MLQHLVEGGIAHVLGGQGLRRSLHLGFVQPAAAQGDCLALRQLAVHSVLEQVVGQLGQGQALDGIAIGQRCAHALQLIHVADAAVAHELGGIEDRAAAFLDVCQSAQRAGLCSSSRRQLTHRHGGDAELLGTRQPVVAVDHVGDAVSRVGPHVDDALGHRVPPVHAGEAVADLLANLVDIPLELEARRVGLDLGSRAEVLVPVTHQQALAGLLLVFRQAFDDVGPCELFPLPAGVVADQPRQLRVVLWRCHLPEVGAVHCFQQLAVAAGLPVSTDPICNAAAWGHHVALGQVWPGGRRVTGLEDFVQPWNHRALAGGQLQQLGVIQLLDQRQDHIRFRQVGVVAHPPRVNRDVLHLGEGSRLGLAKVFSGDLAFDCGDLAPFGLRQVRRCWRFIANANRALEVGLGLPVRNGARRRVRLGDPGPLKLRPGIGDFRHLALGGSPPASVFHSRADCARVASQLARAAQGRDERARQRVGDQRLGRCIDPVVVSHVYRQWDLGAGERPNQVEEVPWAVVVQVGAQQLAKCPASASCQQRASKAHAHGGDCFGGHRGAHDAYRSAACGCIKTLLKLVLLCWRGGAHEAIAQLAHCFDGATNATAFWVGWPA